MKRTWTALGTVLAGVAAAVVVGAPAPAAAGPDLRVLPLGDSITWGEKSSTGSGYRGDLWTTLAAAGYRLDFVGGEDSGTVLVASIVPSADPGIQSQIAAYNRQIPGLVQTRRDAGEHVAFVDMGNVTTADLDADGIHPNDSGYRKMAANGGANQTWIRAS